MVKEKMERKGFLRSAFLRSVERINLLRNPPRPYGLRRIIKHIREVEKRPAMIIEYKRCGPRGFLKHYTPWDYIRKTISIADAYSVLVEPYWFCGSLELIPWFAQYRPVLAKDFVVSFQQLLTYRQKGASAALLILDMLGWEMLDDLYADAMDIGIEVVIETSNANDALEVMHSYPNAMIGLNARDLKTLNVNFTKLLTEISKVVSQKPSNALLIAESGIDSLDKALKLAELGVDGMLIGTWVMKDPSTASKKLVLLKNKERNHVEHG